MKFRIGNSGVVALGIAWNKRMDVEAKKLHKFL